MLPYIVNMNGRIRESEVFPRIRDAEDDMREKTRSTLSKNLLLKHKKKQKKSESDIKSSCVFNTFAINKDPSISKYMPFDEIIYPKLFNDSTFPSEGIQDLWMSGLIDETYRNNVRTMKKKIKMYSEMPDSAVFPHLIDSLESYNQASLPTLPTVYSIDRSLKSTSSHSSLISNTSKVVSDHKKSLTVDEQYRLDQLDKSLNKKRIPKIHEQFKPYQDSNNRMTKARKPMKKIEQLIHANEIESYFDNERKKHSAAIIIQKMWRRPVPIRQWRHASHLLRMALKIQKVARGFLARRYVAHWIYFRNKYIPLWQSRMRKWLSNQHLKFILAREKAACTAIQKIIRSKIAKERWKRLHADFAATRIQCLWRGITGRVVSDRIWLEKVVIPIQKAARRMLAKIHVKRLRRELNTAALQIQSWYRSWYSSKETFRRLYTRETNYRNDVMAILCSEEEYGEDTLLKLAERITKKNIRERLEVASKDLTETYVTIQAQENEILETKRQLYCLTPRAIQMGWKSELQKTANLLREKLTLTKLDALFNKSLHVRQLEDQLESRVEELESMARLCLRASHCRDLEAMDNNAREVFKNSTETEKKRRQSIGEEKRKWTVRFYNSDGKPDRRRRPGRAWDPAAVAGPEKATYTAGHGVDLMVKPLQGEDKIAAKIAPQKAVDHALSQLSLQTYLNQVNQYEGLLNPLMDIMERTTGGGPGVPLPQEQGWGAEGAGLVVAMREIGAVPAAWSENTNDVRSSTTSSPTSPNSGYRRRKRSSVGAGSRIDEGGVRRTDSRSRSRKPSNSDNWSRTSSPPSPTRTRTMLGDVAARKSSISASVSSTSFSPSKNKTSPLKKEEDEVKILEDNRRTERRKRDEEYYQKRRERKLEKRRDPAIIPWALLDALDGEKQKLEKEKNYINFAHKY
eukprot:gene9643-20041_t